MLSRKTRIELILTAVYVGIMAALLLVFAACSTVSSTPPADWPELRISVVAVPAADVRAACTFRGVSISDIACALINFDAKLCTIIHSDDVPMTAYIDAHERDHCAGKDHPGEDTLRRAWEQWKTR